jgi:hypothetical protein
MKSLVVFLLSAIVLSLGLLCSPAQTNSSTLSPEGKPEASSDKHINSILAALNLNNPAKEDKVRSVMSDFLTANAAWHQTNDAALKGLWNDFNRARSKQDKAGADKALAGIESVYGTFKPEHEKLISGLSTVLSPQQIETVEDVLTVKKVEVTYNVYLEIFPTLTADQKAVVLKDLKDAREEAIDAGSMTEKSAFFKKYKIEIEEDYLTAQGYDPKQARKDFADKQKATDGAQ